ncbi:MAG TPA: MarR family transcriptional regulator [Candidatus Dormibacteraeota bacterium]|nr:MarR family transcriptional regulator [Candidatus Dormibacteraeota bacterium]
MTAAARQDLEAWTTAELLALATRLGERAWREFLGTLGVSMAVFGILKALDPGPASQVQLATRCRIGPQSLGRTVDRMERDGLVRRERARGDRRQMVVVRTEDGDRMVAEVEAAAAEGAERFFACLPDPARFRADLLRLIGYMSETVQGREDEAP